MKRCILIGAGDFFEEKIDVCEDDFVIAVDGGYAYAQTLNLPVDLFVGDFDSFEEKDLHIPVLKSKPEKDDTDMLLAIHKGMELGYDEFVLYGAMGGRLEHTFANIQCLKFLCEQKKHGIMIDRKSSIEVVSNCKFYPSDKRGYISIFSLSDESIVSLSHLKYELDHYTMTSSYPIGVDNEFMGVESEVCVHAGVVCIIVSEG